ncbi:hypothetical protein GCM10027569_09680 [Flindersiella endophytica]
MPHRLSHSTAAAVNSQAAEPAVGRLPQAVAHATGPQLHAVVEPDAGAAGEPTAVTAAASDTAAQLSAPVLLWQSDRRITTLQYLLCGSAAWSSVRIRTVGVGRERSHPR